MTCHWCKQPGKRFRNLPVDGTDKVAPWCQKCPDPRYKPRKSSPKQTVTANDKETDNG